MAGYPKIWTRLRHEPWFRPLKAAQRCIWYEVLLIAKEQTDDGWVCFPNITAMAAETGTDRKSCEVWLTRESGGERDCNGTPAGIERERNGDVTGLQRGRNGDVTGALRVSKVEKSRSILRFYLVNYNKTQGVKKFRELKKNAPKGREGKERKIKGREYEKEIREIIKDLNIKSKKKPGFKYCESNIDIITPRLNEGRTVNDFKHINTVKCDEWLGTEQEQYIRPETLYCKKHFESYLNQRSTKQIEADEKFRKTEKCPECGNVGPVIEERKDYPDAKKYTGKEPIGASGSLKRFCYACKYEWNIGSPGKEATNTERDWGDLKKKITNKGR